MLMAFRHVTTALFVLCDQEENKSFITGGTCCLFTTGDIESTSNCIAVLVGRTQVANGAPMKVDAVGGKVGERIAGKGDGRSTRFVGGRSEAVSSSGGNFCIVKYNNKFLK